MSVFAPPLWLRSRMERVVPGGYGYLVGSILVAHDAVPAAVTSWFRTAHHNREVGGSDASQHLVGYAVDLAYSSSRHKATAQQRMVNLGLHVVDEGDHLHVQLLPAGELAKLIRL